MDADNDKMMQYLLDLEEVAEDVMADRQQMVDLDRRRQKTREAIRALHKMKGNEKQWVCFGNMFLKVPKEQTKQILDKDFDKLDKEMDTIRTNLKPKVNKLRDMEHKEEIKGFNLQALSKEEMSMLNSVL